MGAPSRLTREQWQALAEMLDPDMRLKDSDRYPSAGANFVRSHGGGIGAEQYWIGGPMLHWLWNLRRRLLELERINGERHAEITRLVDAAERVRNDAFEDAAQYLELVDDEQCRLAAQAIRAFKVPLPQPEGHTDGQAGDTP